MAPEDKHRIIWRYLDGACTADERAQVETWIVQDPAFREAFETAQLIDQSLLRQELERPSMRFATNVMEHLPAPLVRLRSWSSYGKASRWYAGSLVASLAAGLVYVFTNPVSLAGWETVEGMAATVVQESNDPLANMVYFASIGVFFFLGLDRLLSKRLQSKSTKPV